MAVVNATALRPDSENLWEVAVNIVGDDLKSQVNFDQDTKLGVIDDMLKQTENAKQKLVGTSWSYTRKNGQKVIVRDVLSKIAKWVNHFKAVGDAAVQYDPAHAALPWAGVRFLLTAIMGDLNTYNRILEGITQIAEYICRNTLVEVFLSERTLTAGDGLGNALAELREALVRLYAKILEYLTLACKYYQQSTAKRLGKYGIGGSNADEPAFAGIEAAQKGVSLCSDVVNLQAQTEDHKEIKILLKEINTPLNRSSLALDAMSDRLHQQQRLDILIWLSDEPYKAHHEQTKGDVLKGTGEWLLKHPTFKQWKNDSASSMLWLHGIPGSGKSKLTSIVIEDAEADFERHLSPAPVYFYCSRNPAEPGRSDPSKITASIVRQLATSRIGGPVCQAAVDVYNKRKDDGFAAGPLRFDEMKDLIFQMLNQYADTTITLIIDALDECNEVTRRQLLNLLSDLLVESPCLLKIFISSRNDQDIVYKLEHYPSVEILSNRNSTDINLFVRHETDRLIHDDNLLRGSSNKVNLRNKIIQTIQKKADGMFRLASLQLQALSRCVTDDAVKKQLKNLPGTLTESYKTILLRIESHVSESDKRTAINALGWLLYGREQLPSRSFLVAVSATDGRAASTLSQTQLLELCCNFVVFDRFLDAFRFAHLSAREFLEKLEAFKPMTANAPIAEFCLRQIMRLPKIPETLAGYETRVNFALLDEVQRYSIMFWPEHAGVACEQRKPELDNLLSEFLSEAHDSSSHFFRWKSYLFFRRKTARLSLSTTSALLAVCAYNLHGPLKLSQWKRLTPTDEQNEHLVTALRFKSIHVLQWLYDNMLFTQEAVLKLVQDTQNKNEVMVILEKYLDRIPITDSILQATVANQSEEVIQILLEKRGDDIHITEEVVKAAARNFYKAKEVIVTLLSKRGSEVHVTEDIIEAAVRNSGSGEKVLALLFDKFENQIYINEETLKTALRKSECDMKFRRGILMGFLKRFPNQIQITKSVIKEAAEHWRYGGRDVMGVIVERGGECITDILTIAAENREYGREMAELTVNNCTGLIQITEHTIKAACMNWWFGGKKVIGMALEYPRILLTPDAVTAAATAWGCDESLVTLLLKTKRTETVSVITKNTCIAAAATGNLKTLQLLCRFMSPAEIDPRWERITELYRAAVNNEEDQIRDLMTEPIPLDTKDRYGRTPLWNAASCGNTEVVRILARKRTVDVNSLSNDKQSPIFMPAARGYIEIVNILLSAGAKSQFTDTKGQTPLSLARGSSHDDVVQVLMVAQAAEQQHRQFTTDHLFILISIGFSGALLSLWWALLRG